MTGGVRILPFLTASVAVHALVIGMLGAERLTLATAPTGAGHEVSIRLEAAAPTRAAATTPQPATEPEPEAAQRPVASAPVAGTTARAAAAAQATAVDAAKAATTAAAGERERRRDERPPGHAETRPRTQPEEPVAEADELGDGAAPTRSNASRNEVRDAIVARLAEHFQYPRLAQRRGWQGTVVLSVRILPDGRLSDISVKKSSGRALLDHSAAASLGHVQRIPQLANRVGASGLALEIPVTYRLEAA